MAHTDDSGERDGSEPVTYRLPGPRIGAAPKPRNRLSGWKLWAVRLAVFAVGFTAVYAYATAAREANASIESIERPSGGSQAILADQVRTEDGWSYVLCDDLAKGWVVADPRGWGPTADPFGESFERAATYDGPCPDRLAAGPDLAPYTQTGTPEVPIPAGATELQILRGRTLDQVEPGDHAWVAVAVPNGKVVIECTWQGDAIIPDEAAALRGEMTDRYARVAQFDDTCAASTDLTVWTRTPTIEVNDA